MLPPGDHPKPVEETKDVDNENWDMFSIFIMYMKNQGNEKWGGMERNM